MNKKTLLFITVLIITSKIYAQSPNKCTYTINSWSYAFDGEDVGNMPNVTIHDSDLAAKHPVSNIKHNPALSLKPGDVICVDGGINYKYLKWSNIRSTEPAKPIIIKNTNGQVVINTGMYYDPTNPKSKKVTYGWQFKNSKNFKLIGNGDLNYKYGFKITTPNNSYLQMVAKTTDFEISNVEIAGHSDSTDPEAGFVGIMAKSQPICWDDTNGGSTDKGNFEMKNVFIHHNYIHGVGGEGMYIGYGKTKGVWLNSRATKKKCTRINIPHNISNLHIYNNIVENVGWDGIQVKNAYKNANVYNNVVKNYANEGNGPHDEGIFVGDGSEAVIYGNWIEGGTSKSNGIQINAFGNTKIYNNVVLGAGYTGIYLNNNNFVKGGGTFEIYNNTLQGGTGSAIRTHTIQDLIIKNNIGFGYGTDDLENDPSPTKGMYINTGGTKTISSNLMSKDVSNIGFVATTKSDVRLDTGSAAIDAGERNILNKYDYTGGLRNKGNVDIGAIERGSSINNTTVNLTINTPSSNNIIITKGDDVSVKATLIDINNKVKSTKFILNKNVLDTYLMPKEIVYRIPYESFISGENKFYIETTLFGGNSFLSKKVTINFPAKNSIINVYYSSLSKGLVIKKPTNTNIEYLEVYNLLGQKLRYYSNFKNENNTIDLEILNLKEGLYIVRVKTDKQIFSKKIIFREN